MVSGFEYIGEQNLGEGHVWSVWLLMLAVAGLGEGVWLDLLTAPLC